MTEIKTVPRVGKYNIGRGLAGTLTDFSTCFKGVRYNRAEYYFLFSENPDYTLLVNPIIPEEKDYNFGLAVSSKSGNFNRRVLDIFQQRTGVRLIAPPVSIMEKFRKDADIHRMFYEEAYEVMNRLKNIPTIGHSGSPRARKAVFSDVPRILLASFID